MSDEHDDTKPQAEGEQVVNSDHKADIDDDNVDDADNDNEEEEEEEEEDRDDVVVDEGDGDGNDHNDDNDDNEGKESTKIDEIDFERPAKKGRTAYFIFADERRKDITSKHPGQPVSFVAKILGQEWKAMDDDAKAPYHERAAAEKEKYGVYMKEALARGDQFTLEGGPGTGKPSGTTGPLDMVYPAAKVRKICKLDPEVKNVSREALQLIVKAAELFTVAIGKESVKVARFNNRRKLLPEDVAHVCVHRDAFTFLKDDVKDLVRWQREAARKEKKQKESAAKEAAAVAAKDSDGVDGDDSAEKKSTTKRMTDYFSSASASASK